MAGRKKQMAAIVFLGIFSFILGVVAEAERKKLAGGTPVLPGDDDGVLLVLSHS